MKKSKDEICCEIAGLGIKFLSVSKQIEELENERKQVIEEIHKMSLELKKEGVV